MIHPIPPGTRDILPDEMRELRQLQWKLLEAFASFGYGEVGTPTIEYDEVLARGDGRTAGAAYRFFDERGDLLALRSDMTIPIARLVAGRYAGAAPPFRLCYMAPAYRAVRPQQGQMREFTQAGVELIGARGPAGHRRGGRGAAGGARRDRADPRGDRDRRLRALPPGARRARHRGRGARVVARPPREARPRRPPGGARDARRSRRRAAGDPGLRSRSCAAAARCSSGRARSAAPRSSGRRRACRVPSTSSSAAAPQSVSRSTSACCATSATTAARSSRSTTRRSATCSAAAAATTGCWRASGATCPPPGFALYLERLHVAQAEEQAQAEDRGGEG